VDALNEKQLALFTTQENNALSPEDAELPCVDSADLYAERRAYLETWPKVDAYLLARAKGYQRIICFGAGTWCQLLGAYCPGFWAMVSHCVVDDFGGNCLDKRVEPFVRENVRPNDLLVLATPPATQEKLEPRFRDLGISTVLWNDFIQR
jgi:hypothetical protein